MLTKFKVGDIVTTKYAVHKGHIPGRPYKIVHIDDQHPGVELPKDVDYRGYWLCNKADLVLYVRKVTVIIKRKHG